jgi:hypothetical protein
MSFSVFFLLNDVGFGVVVPLAVNDVLVNIFGLLMVWEFHY